MNGRLSTTCPGCRARRARPSEAHSPLTPQAPSQRSGPRPGDRGPGRIHSRVSEGLLPPPGPEPRGAAAPPAPAAQPGTAAVFPAASTPCPRAAAAALIGRAPGKQGAGSQWEGCARGQHAPPGERSRGAARAGPYIRRFPARGCSDLFLSQSGVQRPRLGAFPFLPEESALLLILSLTFEIFLASAAASVAWTTFPKFESRVEE